MENLQKLVLVVHIVSGFIALTVGIIPMMAPKGSRLHVTTGRVYVWAMYLVSASAVMMFLIKPYRPFLLYLAFIGIFSFYMTYTGVQSVKCKDKGIPTGFDWLITGVAGLSGSAMILLSGWHLMHQEIFFGILYAVFGVFTTRLFWTDWQKFRGRITSEKMSWFFLHISRIVGAYIATFTAFCVVNAGKVEFIHPLVAWLAPGIIGGIGISRWIRYYRKKMRLV